MLATASHQRWHARANENIIQKYDSSKLRGAPPSAADRIYICVIMTLTHFVEKGLIVRIDVPLAAREQPARLLYGTPDFVRWLDERIRLNEASPLLADTTPAEQLDTLFYIFVSGQRLVYSRQFRYIKAEKHAVWELKTPDFRIFGWFSAKDCFICTFGDWADKIKDHDLYRGYRLETRRIRREMGVDESFCVQSLDPNDVMSL